MVRIFALFLMLGTVSGCADTISQTPDEIVIRRADATYQFVSDEEAREHCAETGKVAKHVEQWLGGYASVFTRYHCMKDPRQVPMEPWNVKKDGPEPNWQKLIEAVKREGPYKDCEMAVESRGRDPAGFTDCEQRGEKIKLYRMRLVEKKRGKP